MAGEDAQKILAEEILQDARRRASEIQAAAKAEAEKMLSEAQAVARTEAEKILAEHNARAQRRAEMILRMVKQEVARGKLRARDTVIQAALDQAWERLSNIPLDEYQKVVTGLAVAAIRQMPASDFVVKVGVVAGLNLDAESLASEIVAALSKEGRTVNVRVQPHSTPAHGVLVESADGRLRWDNTFEGRLTRLRPMLRRLSIPIVFEET